MTDKPDLIIIGGGPGGYVAAVRAVQLGMKTVCVERDERLGGVCLNRGCIPSKALLDSTEFFVHAKDRLQDHGIDAEEVSFDLSRMMERKRRVVADLTGNVQKMLSGNGVEVIRGTAKLAGPDSVQVEAPDGETRTLQAGRILLATGSEPVRVGNIPVDGKRIVDSTDALSFTEVPRHLVVVGGGYIGLELGSVWRRLGAKVTVVEMLPRIAAAVDGQVARSLDRLLRKQGFEFRMKTKVENAEVDGDRVRVSLSGETGSETLECDRVLVAVGRRPLTAGLGLSSAGVETDEKTGHVLIDGEYKTTVDSIYAIGDLVPGPMLAHKASAEGIAAVECMAGKPGEVNYDAVPSVIYTYPEVAAVGMTEETLKERGIRYCSGTYPFSGAGRARCMGETDGFVKILAHEATDRILGIHVIGPRAADMIAEGVLAVEFQAGAEDVSRTIHGHPTFAETLMEAAMAIRKCSIYGG